MGRGEAWHPRNLVRPGKFSDKSRCRNPSPREAMSRGADPRSHTGRCKLRVHPARGREDAAAGRGPDGTVWGQRGQPETHCRPHSGQGLKPLPGRAPRIPIPRASPGLLSGGGTQVLWPQVLPWGSRQHLSTSRAYSSLAPFLPGEETRGARAGRGKSKGIFGRYWCLPERWGTAVGKILLGLLSL